MTPSRTTIQDVILRARRDLQDVSDKPGSDAHLLLANVLGQSRSWVIAHPEVELDPPAERYFLTAVDRYRSGQPLPYVLGWWEFYGRRFHVNDSVLIPRPETEHLVERALQFLLAHPGKRFALDIGTGSGCIAITALAEFTDLEVVATDISYEALKVAKENAALYGVESRLRLVQMDLTNAIQNPFDLICANLPYIPTATLQTLNVARNEPHIALDGGEDGLIYTGRILRELPRLLNPGGCALVEMEAGKSGSILELARTSIANANFELIQDLAGHDRVLAIELVVE